MATLTAPPAPGAQTTPANEPLAPNEVLAIEGLEVEFSSEGRLNRAVQGVSFRLRAGETIGIVGESGSGKSVTSLSIMQLIPNPPGRIAAGNLWFRSPSRGVVDLRTVAPADLRHFRGNEISMIFQEPMTSLNPVFTCGNQVIEALRLHQKMDKAAARARTLELFSEVQLPRPEAILESYPHQISGGQKQRVMIAMAMACNPRILIADEPTTALDVTVQKTILELMQQLQQKHDMSILFITHDLGVIAEIADRVIVMYKGRIVEQGPVQEIFANPQHPYTKGLLACRPRMDVRLRCLPTIADFMEVQADGTLSERATGTDGHALTVAEALAANTVPDAEHRARQEKLQAQEPLLRVEGLKTWFPQRSGLLGRVTDHVKAVDDVSLAVYPGETLGLVGESGCGKTTLGRTILRLVEPTAGSIHFRGQDITQLSQAALRPLRRHMQIIFQDPYGSLNPRMPIGQAILEPMQVHKILDSDSARRQRVRDLLDRVGLNPDMYGRYPHEFSGGQRQRVCIARALALQPQFIVCDESVSALDVSVQAQVLNLLNELRDEFQLTYIFISHDLSVVKFMSDRMVVMHQGRIVEAGHADDIYHAPQQAYTRQLIDAIPLGRLEDIQAAQVRRGR